MSCHRRAMRRMCRLRRWRTRGRRAPIRADVNLLERLEPRIHLTAVTVVSPTTGSHAADVGTSVTATFDTAIDNATVSDQSFVVQASQSGRLLTANGAIAGIDVDGPVVELVPVADFHAGEQVQATVTAAIESATGMPVAPFVWSFRVGPIGGTGELVDSEQDLGANAARTGVALGDVDGDGDVDAIVARFNPRANRVWLNDGNGAFTDSGQSLGNQASQDVALGDVDGDGDLDAFVANENANIVWLNDGSGNFSGSGQTLGNSDSYGVDLGDFDGDGDLDAFVANGGFNDVPDTVWLNDGNGVFTENGQALSGAKGSGVAVGDLDGDGDLDALVANTLANDVLLNDGSGTFVDTGQALGDALTENVALGDVDGDGDLDAFSANYYAPHRVWINDGGATFSDSGQAIGTLYTNKSFGVSFGDMDDDGDLDAFIVNRGLPHTLLVNDANGNFTDSGQAISTPGGRALSLADLDRDGDLDAFVADGAGSRVLLNVSRADLSITKTASRVAVVEGGQVTYTIVVSNAGLQDVSGASVSDSFPLQLRDLELTAIVPTAGAISALNTGAFTDALSDTVDLPAGSSITYTVTATIAPAGTSNQAVESIVTNPATVTAPAGVDDADLSNNKAHDSDLVVLSAVGGSGAFLDNGQTLPDTHISASLGDLDGDGDGDVDAFLVNGEQPNTVLLNQGGGTFIDSGQALTNAFSFAVALGDLDGDGDLDAYVGNQVNQPDTVWLNDGGGNFTDSGQALGASSPSAVQLGDWDGDGDLDAVVVTGVDTDVWLNDGSGRFTDSGQSLGSFSVDVAAGDVDGDGDLDFFLVRGSSPSLVLINDGSATFVDSGQSLAGSGQSRGVSLGDLDGDGDLDAFVVGDNDVVGGPDEVWLNDGSGVFSNSGQALGNSAGEHVSLGDLDGDGDLDAFVANRANYPNSVWLNDASGVFTDTGQALGSAYSRDVALGDLEGDGDLDAFVPNAGQASRVWLNRDSADLAITKTAGRVAVVEGGQVTYTIVVSNAGPQDVVGAAVSDTFPAPLENLELTAIVPTLGATSTLGTGPFVGALSDTVDLPVGSSITYTVTATVAPMGSAHQAVEAIVTNAATVTPPANIEDFELSNNMAHDSDVVVPAAPGGLGMFDDSGQALGTAATRGVALGDLDGDGDLDAFVTNSEGEPNRVWLNDGSGAFADSGQMLGGVESFGVSLGDLDDDGDLDAFVANGLLVDRPNVVWLNDGSGVFTDSGQALGNARSFGVVLGDVDGDGDLDGFVTNFARPNAVWLNDGSGTFVDSGQALGNAPSLIASLGDVDGDGDLDGFVANLNETAVVWLNDGDGAFSDSGQVLSSATSFDASLGDLDGDGDLDAFIANSGQPNTLWLNDASGGFTDSGQALGNSYSEQVALGDVDADGDLDAFVANAFDQPNIVWLNDGSGSLSDSGQELGRSTSLGSSLGDVDGDGDLDAFVANYHDPSTIYLNRSADLSITKASDRVAVVQGEAVTYTIVVSNTGTLDVTGATVDDAFPTQLENLELTGIAPSGGAASSLTTGSLTGPLMDTVDLPAGASIVYTITATVVSAGTANQAVESIVTNPATVTGPPGVRIGEADLSNNTAHDSDLVVPATDGGTGVFIDNGQSLGGDVSLDVALGDPDGDGDQDAFIAAGGGQPNVVRLNDGGGAFSDTGQALGSASSFGAALGDLDDDGDLDAFVANGLNQPDVVWLNDGSGNFNDSGQALGSSYSRNVDLGDLDGDGDLDAFVATGGQETIWLNDGSGNFTDTGQSTDLNSDVALGDVDGDGDLDAVLTRSGLPREVRLNDGSAGFADSGQALLAGAGSPGVSLGDLDGDGDLDAFFASGTDGAGGPSSVFFNNGSGVFANSGQALGVSRSRRVSLGDLDDDGDLDAIVVNSSYQPNEIWLNDSSGHFTDGGQVGNASSRAVALADLDGDGDLDVFVANIGGDDRVWLNANPPTVTEVLIGGTDWTGDFLDELEPANTGVTRGYAIASGATQLDPSPWANADQVILRFSEPVDVVQTDLALRGTLGPDGVEDAGDDYAFSAFTIETFPGGAFQAVWTLRASIGSDRLLLVLDDGVVASASGLALDGEWTDEASDFPSGDGAAGGDFAFRFDVAPADVDRDGAATIFDIRPLREALGSSAGDAAYSIFADLNGNANVDNLDKAPLRAELGRVLPATAPQSAPGRGGGTNTILTGDDWIVTTPSDALAGSVDIVLNRTDGGSIDLLNYSVRVRLDGPSAGTQVVLTGGGEASSSPAATAPDPLNATGNVDLLPDEYYHGTVNFTETPFAVDDGDGLIRVDYEVQVGALGIYSFEIVSGETYDSALIWNPANGALGFSRIAPRLIVTIPGDLTGDFTVGADDLQTVLANFTQTVPIGDLSQGDASGDGGVPDGVVGTADLQVVLANFTNSVTPPTSRAAARSDAVDAPSDAGAADLARWQGWAPWRERVMSRSAVGTPLPGEVRDHVKAWLSLRTQDARQAFGALPKHWFMGA